MARAFLCHVSTHRLEVKKAALFRRSCLLAASDGRTKVIALLEDEAHAIVGPIQVTRPPGPALRPSCSVALLPIAAALCSSADGLRSRFPTHAPVCSPPATVGPSSHLNSLTSPLPCRTLHNTPNHHAHRRAASTKSSRRRRFKVSRAPRSMLSSTPMI